MQHDATTNTMTHDSEWWGESEYREPAAQAWAEVVSGEIIAAAIEVHRQLGHGLPESVFGPVWPGSWGCGGSIIVRRWRSRPTQRAAGGGELSHRSARRGSDHRHRGRRQPLSHRWIEAQLRPGAGCQRRLRVSRYLAGKRSSFVTGA